MAAVEPLPPSSRVRFGASAADSPAFSAPLPASRMVRPVALPTSTAPPCTAIATLSVELLSALSVPPLIVALVDPLTVIEPP